MAVWMIAWANIRKKKGVALSLGILILLSVALFHVGLTLLTGIQDFYDRENERLSGADFMVRFEGNEYREDYLEFFLKDERVAQAETEEVVLMNMTTFPDGGALSCTFRRMELDRSIRGFERMGASGEVEGGEIYIPAFFREMGYEPGDTLTLEFKKQDYQFVIAGYTLSTWFHSSVSSMVDIYMTEEAYQRLFSRLGGGYLLTVRTCEEAELAGLKRDFKEQTDVNMESISIDSRVMAFSIDEMRSGCTMLVTILSAILFAFSFIIVIVVWIVIRFRIANHIEGQMQNIGALGAMGYTGKQIKWSIALEFLMIGLVGTVLGILASYGMLNLLSGLIVSSMGIVWKNGNHGLIDIISAAVVMAVVLLVSQRAARKAAGILPVKALRRGIENHNFEKNHIPLEHAPGSLSFILGLKSMVFQKKTYIMVGTIFTGIAFACGFAVVFFMNMGLDDRMMVQMSGYEISDLMVYAAPHGDYDQLREEIEELEGVRKTSVYETASATIHGEMITACLSEDFSQMETVDVYAGTFPVYGNEVALTGVLADTWGVNIGDTIEISVGGISGDYIICGLGQTMSNFGRQCYLSLEGQRRIDPTYEVHSIQVYLEPGIDVKDYIGFLERQFKTISPSVEPEADERTMAKRRAEEKMTSLLSMYGVDSAQYALMADGEIILSGDTSEYRIDRIENNRDIFVSNVESMGMAVSLVSAVILAGTLVIISLVFYMVIKSMIVKRRHEFGIYKAIGYTDRQLMQQVAVSFLPVSIIGTALGSLISCLTANRISSLLFHKLGVSRMDLAVNPWIMIAVGICIVAYSFGISMAVAGKIRGISVYSLLTEE